MALFIEIFFLFPDVSFRVMYGAPQVRSLRKFRVSLNRRTPPCMARSSDDASVRREVDKMHQNRYPYHDQVPRKLDVGRDVQWPIRCYTHVPYT